jgi:cytochrome c-type biogenesis protein CcmE
VQLRVILGSGLILGALMVVAMVSFYSNQEVYLTVDDLLASPAYAPAAVAAGGSAAGGSAAGGSAAGRPTRLQLRGVVDYETVQRPPDGLEMRFTLEGRDGGVPVVYQGIVPDSFDIAESVTVGGRMGDDGTFVADQLFVQCPSKYEAAPPGADAAAERG